MLQYASGRIYIDLLLQFDERFFVELVAALVLCNLFIFECDLRHLQRTGGMLQKMKCCLLTFMCLFACVSWADADESEKPSLGVSVTEDRLANLEQNSDVHPLIVMRLLKFKSDDGLKHYEEFLDSYSPLLRELGGELLFLGSTTPYKLSYESSHELFGLKENPWDLLAIERVRSRKDLRKLRGTEAYQKAEAELVSHLTEFNIHALNGTLRGGERRSLADTVVAPEFPDGEELFELNLLRFRPDGGEDKYYGEYAKHVLPMIRDVGSKVIYGLKSELMLAGTERYDRVVLVMYPSEKAFHQMVMSDEYQAVSPNREDALEVGHLFGFKNEGRRLRRFRNAQPSN
ncbi:DUF1330 domain-containing protein [Stieleria sp. JC731]|uniref:DUF1330 domain-containing protein n=1 Tax=Pirellulaceae TaxID=2691357 RepID=UPI001E4A78F7|nr:DUF1330 domain-containing protein [Stieleria sp. JC731]MCC9601912.1 DUF1330 domain-containing protein [Stieleria sp. JC731]